MREQAQRFPLIAKAIRIVLVFSLVFWSSFSLQALALAATFIDSGAGHEDGALYDLEAWEFNPETMSPTSRVLGAAEAAHGKEQASDIKMTSEGGTLSFVAMPKWVSADAAAAAAEPGDYIADFVTWRVDGDAAILSQDNQGIATLQGVSEGVVTVTCELRDSKLVNAEFPEAKASSPLPGGGASQAPTQTQTGSSSSESQSGSETESEPQSTPEPEMQLQAQAEPRTISVSFKVYVKSPYVNAVQITRADGSPFGQGDELSLTKEDAGSYRFGAIAHTYDEATGATFEYATTPEQGLGAASGGKYADLAWSVTDEAGQPVDAAVASITPEGVLTLKGTETVYVQCSSPNGLNGEPTTPTRVAVRSGDSGDPGSQGSEAKDPQGESHPQNTLTVIVNGLQKKDDAQGAQDAQNSAASPAAADDAGVSTQADGDEEADNPDAAQDAGAGQEPAEILHPIEPVVKAYSVADLESLGFSTETYQVFGSESGLRTVTGQGTTLALILNDMGISVDDQVNIDSISFTDYRGITKEAAWSAFTGLAAGSYVMVAARSYVHVDGDEGANANGSSSGSSAIATQAEGDEEPVEGDESAPGGTPAEPGSPSASSASASPSAASPDPAAGTRELLDNTRFRILYNSSTANGVLDPDDLRWINTITVNMKPSDATPPPKQELSVSVDYKPVPKGYEAFLSAVPSKEIGNAQFGFSWQTSADGVEWEDVKNGAMQTLRVPTDDDHIGRYYRVVMETNKIDEATGNYVSATSQPVQISEGTGFVVVLDYVPPIAGKTAIFTSTIIDHYNTIDTSKKVEYVWESSEDGGATWTVLDGYTEASLSVKTEPVEETEPAKPSGDSSSAESPSADSPSADSPASTDDEVIPIVYVRVRAIAAMKDGTEGVAVSNAQPLTVRVGETSGEQGEIVIQDPEDTAGDPTGQGNPTNPVNPDNPSNPQQPSSGGNTITLKEVDNIQVDNTPYVEPASTQAPADGDEQPTQDQPQPQPQPVEATPRATDITDLLVNSEVNAKVAEQQQAVNEAVSATRPGARWTQLSTVNPNADDVAGVLASNPFAPFAMPLGLGIIAAGGVEKLLAFRRETL